MVVQAFRVQTEFDLMLQSASVAAIGSSIMGTGLLLQEAFDLFDKNKDQQLDVDEVWSMLKYLGFDPSPSDVLDFIEITDKNNDNKVGYQEFSRGIRDIRGRIPMSPAVTGQMFQFAMASPSPNQKDMLKEAMEQRRAAEAARATLLEKLKKEEMAALAEVNVV